MLFERRQNKEIQTKDAQMVTAILPPVGDPGKGLLFICELILDKEENSDGRFEQPKHK